jgi:hypothetical protein
MANENAAYRRCAKVKGFTLPVIARLWTSFRCKVDNATSSGNGIYCCKRELEDVPLFADVKARINLSLEQSSPKGFQGPSRSAHDARTKEGNILFFSWMKDVVFSEVFYIGATPSKGFGVFARRDCTFHEVRHALYGFLCPISGDDYDRLKKLKHPSLYVCSRLFYVDHMRHLFSYLIQV